MSCITSTNKGVAEIKIVGDFSIYQAQNLKSNFMQLLNSNDNFRIDLSEVEEFDTSGLQLVIMTMREAKRLGKDIYIKHSPSTRDVWDLLQMK